MVERPHVYANDHAPAVTAQHGRRNVANSYAFLLIPLKSLHPATASSAAELQILDIGCGPGSITIDLARNYYPSSRFTGLEYVSPPLEEARAAADAAGVTNIDFVTGDAMNLTFPENTFDVVYCHQVLQHIADPVHALSEMRRVCKPGGVVAAKEVTPAWFWYPRNLRGLDLHFEMQCKVPVAMGSTPNAGHLLHVWAQKAGFTRDQVTCSTSSWLYTTREERESWGGGFVGRFDLGRSGGELSGFAKKALEMGYTQEDMHTVVEDYKKWIDDQDGWFCVPHGEIVCKN